jgi:hypothetical protein
VVMTLSVFLPFWPSAFAGRELLAAPDYRLTHDDYAW